MPRSVLSLLTAALAAVTLGAAGLGLARATLPASSPEVTGTVFDLASLPEGEMQIIKHENLPILVSHLSDVQRQRARGFAADDLRDPLARNANLAHDAPATFANRSLQSDGKTYVILIGVCDSFGYVPIFGAGNAGGWFCIRSADHFDSLGRYHRGRGAANLPIPRYSLTNDGQLLLPPSTSSHLTEAQLDRLLYGR